MDDGDRTAFLAFCTARTPSLMRTALALCGDRHAAEDLVQSALEQLVRRWRHVEDPENYARRALYNGHVSAWRRAKRQPEKLLGRLPERTTTDASTRVDDHDELARLLAQLAPRQRAVVVLRYLEDMNEQDVAALLGCSQATVSSQLSRALATLRTTSPARVDRRQGSSPESGVRP